MAIDKRIYKSANTLTGQWEIAKDSFPMYTRDPALFLDDDERLYLVFNTNTLTIHSFNRLQNYYFTIDVFNENSITKGEKIVEAIASGQQGISHLTTK
jgi:beta-xylosidase